KPGIIRVVIKGCPQLLENDVQAAIKVDIGAFGPKILTQFLAGDDFSGTLEKKNENAQGLVVYFYANAIARESVLGNIGLKQSEAKNLHPSLDEVHGRPGTKVAE